MPGYYRIIWEEDVVADSHLDAVSEPLIGPHTHDFVGDQDTCAARSGCPVTWHQHRANEKKRKEQ